MTRFPLVGDYIIWEHAGTVRSGWVFDHRPVNHVFEMLDYEARCMCVHVPAGTVLVKTADVGLPRADQLVCVDTQRAVW